MSAHSKLLSGDRQPPGVDWALGAGDAGAGPTPERLDLAAAGRYGHELHTRFYKGMEAAAHRGAAARKNLRCGLAFVLKGKL